MASKKQKGKGKKRCKGSPVLYDEIKRKRTIRLTDSARNRLIDSASQQGESLSECVENVARQDVLPVFSLLGNNRITITLTDYAWERLRDHAKKSGMTLNSYVEKVISQQTCGTESSVPGDKYVPSTLIDKAALE